MRSCLRAWLAPPVRSTTASRTLIGRLLYDSKAIFEDQLESVERTSRERGRRVHEPGAAHRRPAGRARAGHHDRRRLPLLRHAQAEVHHRRHPGPHPVHAQHGHRRLHRRPRARAGRRPQRHRRAVPPPRVPRVAAARPAPRAVRQQDGPRRLRPGPLRGDQGRVPGRSPPSSTSPTSRSSRSRRSTATTSCTARANMPWYEGSSLLHHLEEVHIASDRNLIDARFPVQYVLRPHERRVPRLPRLRRHGRRRRAQAGRRGGRAAVGLHLDRSQSIDTADGPVDEAFAPMSVTVTLDRRHRRLPRRHDLPARTTSPTSARTSTPWSAG